MIQWGLFPSRFEWALRSYRDDPVFAAQVARMTRACPSDPQTAMLALELAACWASDNPELQDAPFGVPSARPFDPAFPATLHAHWLAWQRHLGRSSGAVIERDGWVSIGGAARPMLFPDVHARLRSTMLSVLGAGGLLQLPMMSPRFRAWVRPQALVPAIRQTGAVMRALDAARLPRELPDGFSLAAVDSPEGVADYQAVTSAAYRASYGVDEAGALVTPQALLGHDHVQAWVVYQGVEPVRVISGFLAHGVVGAHAGAAVPEIRGRHFSEPLLARVAAWGYARGATHLVGVAMPQAVPILTRIGASLVEDYVTWRLS